jgi:hypothetical protein
MTAFLNCNIWSIAPYSYNKFYMVERVYLHNSLSPVNNTSFTAGCYQIPEFEIYNIDLLSDVNYDIINSQRIPIIKRSNADEWEINLFYYNEYVKNTNM